MTQPIPYVSEDETRRQARPPRSAAMWIKLLIVWGAGLVVWGFYIVLILYAFFQVML